MIRKVYIAPSITICEVDVEPVMASGSNTENAYTNKIGLKTDNTSGVFSADCKENNIVDFSDDDCWE